MRICLVTSAAIPPREGIGFHVWNLAQRLSEKGHSVGIVTRGPLGPTVRELQRDIPVWHVTFAPVYPLHVHVHGIFLNRLMQQIGGQYDLIHAHSPLVPRLDTSLPCITTVHSPMQADTAAGAVHNLDSLLVHLQTPVSKHVEQTLFRGSCQVTAVARWVAEALERYDIEDIVVTGNGVEDRFLQAPPAEGGGQYVLYVGRLEEGKGLLDLVAAAEMVNQQRPDLAIHYVIVGEGPLLPKLQARLAGTPFSDRFVFMGQVTCDKRDKLLDLYHQARLFILPSHHEGMPTVLLEAMACGLPVIATAVGGCLEVIRDGENGMLVPVRQPEALACAILMLLKNEEHRLTIADRARATIRSQFSLDSVVRRYCTCYEQAISRQV